MQSNGNGYKNVNANGLIMMKALKLLWNWLKINEGIELFSEKLCMK
jgi:hypothetical protein